MAAWSVRPFASDPIVFGGGSRNKDFEYVSIERPAQLQSTETIPKLDHGWVQLAFQSLWDGNFEVQVIPVSSHKTVYQFRVRDERLSDHQGPLFQMHLQAPSSGQDGALDWEIIKNEFVMKQSRILKLQARILHQMLRSSGGRVAVYHMFWIADRLRSLYTEKSLWDELFDLSIVVTDLFFHHGIQNRDTAVVLAKLGECLEQKSRYLEAAEVYKQAVVYMDNENWMGMSVGMFWTYVALAYERAGDFVSAEEYYVIALHHCDQALNGNWKSATESDRMVVYNFVNMYVELDLTGKSTTEIQQTWLAMKEVLAPAHILRLNPTMIWASEKIETVVGSSVNANTNPSGVLSRAVRDRCVSTFRKTFRSQLNENAQSRFFCSRLSNTDSVVGNSSANITKAIRQANPPVIPLCQNPACRAKLSKKLMCPCKALFYCGKDCQKAHWKEHKRACLWHKAKKLGKDGNSS